MFLTLGFAISVLQMVLITLLIVPIPSSFKSFLINMIRYVISNIKIVFLILVILTLGSFFENLFAALRYSSLNLDYSEVITVSVVGKHELMMKLFRAQRNTYLMLMVNFNWFVLYGLYKFITSLYSLENAHSSEQDMIKGEITESDLEMDNLKED